MPERVYSLAGMSTSADYQANGTVCAPCEKNWCIEMPTMDTPMQKLSVSRWPNSAAESTAVNSVAIVDEYLSEA